LERKNLGAVRLVKGLDADQWNACRERTRNNPPGTGADDQVKRLADVN
jgi:hypothetical protein